MLVFQRFFLLERLPLMDARAAINGIQEVSGSIPLISTKTVETFGSQRFFLIPWLALVGAAISRPYGV